MREAGDPFGGAAVHWIRAVNSQISNPDLAVQTFRSVTIHPIPEGGHFVHLEKPDDVNSRIVAFARS